MDPPGDHRGDYRGNHRGDYQSDYRGNGASGSSLSDGVDPRTRHRK
jgi:hypothetical protein